jgi:cytochrome P450
VQVFEPTLTQLIKTIQGVSNGVHEVLSSPKRSEDNEHPTVFHSLVNSDLPASEKSAGRLTAEGETVVGAGTLTTAHYLTTTIYHILANPGILQKLREEVKTVMPDADTLPSYHELNQLPYLSAVVLEGFRMSHGVIARLTRVAPDEVLEVGGYTIAAGTPVSMSSWLIHLNPELFPQPDVFRPERWLEPGAEEKRKYVVNFTRGSHACLGKELARTEIVYTLALAVRRWVGDYGEGMELFDTDRSDVDIEHDFFNPSARLDSKGVRVLLKR